MPNFNGKSNPVRSRFLTPSTFDASVLPISDRFNAINDAYIAEQLFLAPMRAIGNSINTTAKNWFLSDLSVSQAFGHAHIGKAARKSSSKYLYIRKYFSGTFKVWSDGYFVHPQPGDIIIDASSDKLVFSVEELQSCYINIPLDRLSLDIAPYLKPQILSSNTLACRLLSSAIEMWITELPRTHLSEVSLLEASIIDLICSVLKNRPQEEDGKTLARARKRAMKQFVQDHLANPDLCANTLTSAFHMSRPSLYRQFEDEGGVMAYIRIQRMERALALLTSEPAARGRIKEVSEQVAFEDPLHFRRTFKQTFGFSPSDALALAPPTMH